MKFNSYLYFNFDVLNIIIIIFFSNSYFLFDTTISGSGEESDFLFFCILVNLVYFIDVDVVYLLEFLAFY